MINTVFLASVEAVNNWALWCFAVLIAGFIFFMVGLWIGRKYWARFKAISESLQKNCDKQSLALSEKRSLFKSVSKSVTSQN